MKELVTLCIVTKDHPASLVRLMKSINDSVSHTPDIFRVLVIDSSVAPGTGQYIHGFTEANKQLHISYIHIDSVSTSYARNVAISHAGAPYIGYLDDDVELDIGWAESVYKKLSAKKRPGVLFGAICPVTRVLGTARIMFDFAGENTPWIFAANAESDKVVQPYSANLIIRSDVFSRVGLFNEVLGNLDSRHSHSRGEDAEWLLRARRFGIVPVYVDGMRVTHHIPGERVGRFSLFMRFVEDGKNRMLFAFYGSPVWDMRDMHRICRSVLEETLDVYKRILLDCKSLPLSGSWSTLTVIVTWLYMNALFFCGEVIGVATMSWLFIIDKKYYEAGRTNIAPHKIERADATING